MGGRNVRDAQDRNAFIGARLAVQMHTQTVAHRRKRFFGGPLFLPASPAAPSTAFAATRLLLQSDQVARELSLGASIAGPGTIK